jgi:hypothetical protein
VRASARTPAEREEYYRDWRERHGEYLQAVADNDGSSWADSAHTRAPVADQLGESAYCPPERLRRALYFRRYQRPAPPQGLGIPPRVGAYSRSDMTNASSTTEEAIAA